MSKRYLTLGEAKSFTGELFDKEDQAEKTARIIRGVQESRSSRISDITSVREGDTGASYRMIHRFLKDTDTKEARLTD